MEGNFKLKVDKHGGVIKADGKVERFEPTDIRKELQGRRITSLHFKEAGNQESTFLSDLLAKILEHVEDGTSPHGERVIVTLLRGSHFRKRLFRRNYHLRVCLEAHTESGRSVYDRAEINMVFGYYNGYTNWIEVVRCLIQASESGSSMTEEDEAALHRAFLGKDEDIEEVSS